MTIEKSGHFVISADDLGKSQKANENILTLAEEGKIERVAIAANGIFDSAELSRLRSITTLKLDIHLNLAKDFASETETKGIIKRTIPFALKYLSGKTSARQALTLWQDQIEAFKEKFNKLPDGVNSHEHIHFFPPYFKTVLELTDKYGIKYLRFGKQGVIQTQCRISQIIGINWKLNKNRFINSSLESSDFLIGLDWIADFESFTKNHPSGKIEIVTHPERDAEFALLKKISR